MTKVLYDDQIFQIQRFGGISRYFTELITGLRQDDDIETSPKTFHSKNEHLNAGGLAYKNIVLDNFRFRGSARLINYLKNRDHKRFLRSLTNAEFDIFHPTYYDPAYVNLLPGGKPFVITVYDMIHERYYQKRDNELSMETKAKRELLPKAAHIVAISQSTKDDILHFFPQIDPEKITVVYLDSSLPEVNDHPESPFSEPYILFVGNREDYKNFLWFSRSVAGLLKSNPVKLVCAGGGKFTANELSHLENLGIAEKVEYANFKSDAELRAIYKNAICFIFPSLFEGFGIPILEAFSCGCPVVLPDASCFPEIGGDAALYFEQENSESLSGQIQNIIDDKSLAMSLAERGRDRKKIFSWSKTVQQHKKIYQAVASKP